MLRSWLRSWRRNPLLAGQFCLTTVIGMGAVTSVVSLMLALGYEPLPYRDSGRLVAVWERTDFSVGASAMSGPDLTDFNRATRDVFASFGGFWIPSLWLIDNKGPAKVRVCGIQASAFSDLGLRPVLGRGVKLDDEPLTGGAAGPVWISYRLWQSRYGGSRSIIGTTIGVADTATGSGEMRMPIAGVLPPDAGIPLPFVENATDVWYILPSDSWMSLSRQSDVLFGVGRLRAGVTPEQARSALTIVAERLSRQYGFDRYKHPVVESLGAIAHDPARQTMGLLALGLGFVFAVACANLAILMGAEGRRRQREIAIRFVLGAGRYRLWGEVATEKCLLTLLSLGLGIPLAWALLRVLTWLVPSIGLGAPLPHAPPLNLGILQSFAAFALVAALVWASLLIRAAEAPESSRKLTTAGSGLGYTGSGDFRPGVKRWRLVLLATQAGVGICLLAAAALAARTYASVSAADLGPAPRHTVVLSVDQRDNFVPTDAQVREFNLQVLSRLKRLPATQAIALADSFPPLVYPVSFRKGGDVSGIERLANSPTPVSPSYFEVLGIPILFGREFNDADTSGNEPVAIVSLDIAEHNWPSPEKALGSQIFFGSSKSESKEKSKKEGFTGQIPDHYKIVGVAADFSGYWSQKPVPMVYLPLAQAAYHLGGSVILRTSSPRSVAVLASQALAGMEIPATVSDVSTIEARWRAMVTRPLARMAGMLVLALLGLGLSIQGVYAVTAATVAARRHELAVRATLGALPSRLAWTVTRELIVAVIVGCGLGIVAALNLRPMLAHWLGPVATWQVEPIGVAVALLLLTAGVGCYFPARAAARANPADVLRQG